jgi:ribonucleoside-diphosphate reductase alpha chain
MELTREVGLGFTNLHQWFINANVQYDSDEAIEMFEEFMSWYAFYVFEGSQKIAELKGPALAYSETGITSKDLMGSSFFKNIVDKFYEGDYTKVKPLRNLALISIAPTGTLSMTFPVPCISTGAEPGMSAHWRKTRAISKGEYDWYFILPEFIKFELMKEIVNSRVLCSDDLNFISNVGPATPDNTGELGIEVMELINKYLGKGTFKPAHEIDPMQKIKLMSGLYNWVDAAVSITYNLPEDTVAEEVENIYMEAWKQGVRAVSVYREGSREGILVFDPPGNEALKKTSYCETRPEEILFTCAPKRPQDLDCEIHHCKIKGKKFIVLIGMYNGYPYEVFAGEAHEDMYVPTTVKKGILRKIHAKYSLIVLIRGSEVEYRNIAFSFMNEQYRSLTRMISLSLRHGVRPAFITDQLKKADEGITEFSSVVSRVLNNYMKTKDYEYLNKKQKQGDICVLCGGTDWHNSGGCLVCSTCGRGSKCD